MDILINGDSLNLIEYIQGDVIITDPPYGITNNKWDADPIDFMKCINAKQVITTADIKYASFLLSKYKKEFSHDLVWQKTVGSGQLNINRQPLRLHELILIFKFSKSTTYNRLKRAGEPYKINRRIKKTQGYNDQRDVQIDNPGDRDATSILAVPNRRYKNGHPTQKPLKLFQTLADMYSKAEDVIIDPFAGSGTILDIDREVIAIEKDETYYELIRAARKHQIAEKEYLLGTKFEYLMDLLSDTQYTVFGAKSETPIW